MAILRAISRLSRRFVRKHVFLSLIFTYAILYLYGKSTIFTIPIKLPFRFNNTELIICKPPNLNPLDDSIKHLVKDPEFDGCAHPLAFSSTFNSTLVTLMDLESKMGINSCCYQVVKTGTSKHDPDDTYRLSKKCYRVGINKSETVIPNGTEFIVISCIKDSDLSTKRTMDMHAFVHEKPEVENSIKNYYTEIESETEEGLPEEDRVNVVIFGTDSVSQQEFQRSFSKTYKYLKEELSAFEMRGRNAFSDGTFSNLMPMLTGLNHSELARSGCYKTEFFDTCPLTWKKFSENGYRTVYGEDCPPTVGTFNIPPEKGFIISPTDYYFKPFAVAANDLIGNTPNIKLLNKASLCYGPRLSFEVMLDYMRKIAHFMGHKKRYFQFLWNVYLTHDGINYGRLGDEMLLNTLKWFKDEGYLNETVLILLSDHGMRYGEIRKYTQGMIEERLPYLFFVLPPWFKKKYPAACKNLKNNQDKLTTTFDLYETLLDLLHLEGLEQIPIALREEKLLKASLPRGISHFLPIPSWRNCELAEIPEHYCTCHTLKASSEEVVKEAANFIVNEINGMLKEYKKCASLSLTKIRNAYQIDYALDKEKLKDQVEGYKLLIETLPNEAIFEATVLKEKDGNLTMSGTISRVDSYGNQSYCVDVKKLKLYCYCLLVN